MDKCLLLYKIHLISATQLSQFFTLIHVQDISGTWDGHQLCNVWLTLKDGEQVGIYREIRREARRMWVRECGERCSNEIAQEGARDKTWMPRKRGQRWRGTWGCGMRAQGQIQDFCLHTVVTVGVQERG